jgi:hypothetical protein
MSYERPLGSNPDLYGQADKEGSASPSLLNCEDVDVGGLDLGDETRKAKQALQAGEFPTSITPKF